MSLYYIREIDHFTPFERNKSDLHMCIVVPTFPLFLSAFLLWCIVRYGYMEIWKYGAGRVCHVVCVDSRAFRTGFSLCFQPRQKKGKLPLFSSLAPRRSISPRWSQTEIEQKQCRIFVCYFAVVVPVISPAKVSERRVAPLRARKIIFLSSGLNFCSRVQSRNDFSCVFLFIKLLICSTGLYRAGNSLFYKHSNVS